MERAKFTHAIIQGIHFLRKKIVSGDYADDASVAILHGLRSIAQGPDTPIKQLALDVVKEISYTWLDSYRKFIDEPMDSIHFWHLLQGLLAESNVGNHSELLDAARSRVPDSLISELANWNHQESKYPLKNKYNTINFITFINAVSIAYCCERLRVNIKCPSSFVMKQLHLFRPYKGIALLGDADGLSWSSFAMQLDLIFTVINIWSHYGELQLVGTNVMFAAEVAILSNKKYVHYVLQQGDFLRASRWIHALKILSLEDKQSLIIHFMKNMLVQKQTENGSWQVVDVDGVSVNPAEQERRKLLTTIAACKALNWDSVCPVRGIGPCVAHKKILEADALRQLKGKKRLLSSAVHVENSNQLLKCARALYSEKRPPEGESEEQNCSLNPLELFAQRRLDSILKLKQRSEEDHGVSQPTNSKARHEVQTRTTRRKLRGMLFSSQKRREISKSAIKSTAPTPVLTVSKDNNNSTESNAHNGSNSLPEKVQVMAQSELNETKSDVGEKTEHTPQVSSIETTSNNTTEPHSDIPTSSFNSSGSEFDNYGIPEHIDSAMMDSDLEETIGSPSQLPMEESDISSTSLDKLNRDRFIEEHNEVKAIMAELVNPPASDTSQQNYSSDQEDSPEVVNFGDDDDQVNENLQEEDEEDITNVDEEEEEEDDYMEEDESGLDQPSEGFLVSPEHSDDEEELILSKLSDGDPTPNDSL